MAGFEVNEIVAALRGAREEWRDAQKRSREPGAASSLRAMRWPRSSNR